MRIETLAEGVTLYLADCLEVLANMRSASIDVILTDPPYGNSNHDGDWNARLNEHRGIDNKPIANDSAEGMREVVDAMLTQAARLLGKEASACAFVAGGRAVASEALSAPLLPIEQPRPMKSPELPL